MFTSLRALVIGEILLHFLFYLQGVAEKRAIIKTAFHADLCGECNPATHVLLSTSKYLVTKEQWTTKRRGQEINIPALYSGGPGFKSSPRDRTS